MVDSCIFLGSTIHKDGGCEQELRRRLSLGRAAMNKLSTVMKNHDVSRKTKVMLVKSLVFPVMLYGAESWTLKLNDKRRINAFELWCWRRVLRIPWTAKVRNTEVIAIINPTSSLEALVLKQKMTYFGHVMRSKEGIGKSLMLGRTEGVRRRGRQRVRWIHELTSSVGRSLEDLKELAQNRTEWKRLVHDVTRGRSRPEGR